MCVTIQNAIDRIEDNEQKELARDTPYVIMELAEQHSESFYLKVVNSNANDRIMPANQILHRSLVVRCDISTGTPSIGSLIEEEYSRFANGAMADRITEVINQAIELLLNSFTDRTSNGEFYTIIAGSKRGIQRVDVGLYGYRFKSKQLAEIAKNVVVAVVVVSSLGPTKVNEGYLHMLIENQFPEEKQQEILGILLKARKDVLPPHYRE